MVRLLFVVNLVSMVALVGGGLAACSREPFEETGPSSMGGFDAGGGGSGGSPEKLDGSIDVPADSTPAPSGPGGYAALCVARAGDDPDCTPGAAPDGCIGSAPGKVTCQLVPDAGAAVPMCMTPGKGEYNAPCQTAADCAAGLGCAAVGGTSGGACRDYCCGDLEECPESTFCAPRPMAEDRRIEIPVCVLATNCLLLDHSSCPSGEVCTIVRADGTTSCVPPGEGQHGEACPCAEGYMCAKLLNKCKKLCRVADPDCPNGSVCIGGSMEFPDGFGVCTEGNGYN